MEVNRRFFANENKGFQSWCADMWGVLYNLWARGVETKVVPEMDFAWASDPIEKIDKVGIFHNAGVVSDEFNGHPAFYKGKYHTGINPFKDPHMQKVLNDENTKKWCTWWYTDKLWKLYEKYKLDY